MEVAALWRSTGSMTMSRSHCTAYVSCGVAWVGLNYPIIFEFQFANLKTLLLTASELAICCFPGATPTPCLY